MPVNLPWPRPPRTSEAFDRIWNEGDFVDKYEKAFSITDRVAKAIYDKMVSMNVDEGNYVGDYQERLHGRTQLDGDFDLTAIAEAAIAEARE